MLSRSCRVARPLLDSRSLMSSNVSSSSPGVSFSPKRVLILTKMTRLEFEQRTNPRLNSAQLETELKRRGSDYSRLLERHNHHKSYLDAICRALRAEGIETRVVQRFDYTEESIAWADAVFSAGGDGTFLLAASRIRTGRLPVIGVNTDPLASEGYMCLTKKLPEAHFNDALKRLLRGEFEWLWRQRIRITVKGDSARCEPIELHDQQLLHPEHRWTDDHLHDQNASSSTSATSEAGELPVQQLPFLALNEVFIGESLSSRVSYYEIDIDQEGMMKQKSSGLTVCTGTGSTSWYFNINKLTETCVTDLLRIVQDQSHVDLAAVSDPESIARICTAFNSRLVFAPDHPKMGYVIRDPVDNAIFHVSTSRGFAHRIRVKSRCFDALLVIDGGLSYKFNDGSEALLEIHPEDALRTVVFR